MWVSVSTAVGACKAGIGARLRTPSAVQPRNWGLVQWHWLLNSIRVWACLTARLRPLPEEAFGLRVSRAGLCQALERVARKAEPTYAALVEQVRASPRVTPDETG
jgi:Transposase IS66 family